MAASIFPTFSFAGSERRTFVWKDGQRKKGAGLTGHDGHLAGDCSRIEESGIGVARERIRCESYLADFRRWLMTLDPPERFAPDAGRFDFIEVRPYAGPWAERR